MKSSVSSVPDPVPHSPPNRGPQAHVAVERCRVAAPLLPVSGFDPAQSPDLTNARSYCVSIGQRKIPFKYLRSSCERRPALICLHGMGLTTSSFWGAFPYLLPICDLVLIDWSDFATGARWPRRGIPLANLASDLMAVPNALELERFSVAGSSLGGGLSLMTAMDFPNRVEKIILLNPAAYPQKLPGFYKVARIPWLGELAMWWTPPDKLASGIVYTGYANPRRANPALVDDYRRNMQPLANRLKLMHLIRHLPTREAQLQRYANLAANISQPTLLIWGIKDGLIDARTPQRLKDDIPNLRVETLAAIAHLPHEESPAEVGPIMAEFLSTG